eukprot:471734-Pleurochrysis_carterae.AAC.8
MPEHARAFVSCDDVCAPAFLCARQRVWLAAVTFCIPARELLRCVYQYICVLVYTRATLSRRRHRWVCTHGRTKAVWMCASVSSRVHARKSLKGRLASCFVIADPIGLSAADLTELSACVRVRFRLRARVGSSRRGRRCACSHRRL